MANPLTVATVTMLVESVSPSTFLIKIVVSKSGELNLTKIAVAPCGGANLITGTIVSATGRGSFFASPDIFALLQTLKPGQHLQLIYESELLVPIGIAIC